MIKNIKTPWYDIPSLNMAHKQAVVIGAGLAGTSVAYSLAKRGYHIKLIERNKVPATESSGNPVGIITPLLSHKNDIIGRFYEKGFNYTIEHIKKFESDIKYDLCGVIELSKSKINKDIKTLVISEDQITKISNIEASDLCGYDIKTSALYLKNAGWISPVDLCNANINKYSNQIEKKFNVSAIKLEQINDGWLVLDKDNKIIASAPVVIIANSNDANSFTQTSYLPLISVRGQITYVKSDIFNCKKIVCYDAGYVTPAIDGVNYIGATYTRDNINKESSIDDDKINIANFNENIVCNLDSIVSVDSRVSFRATVIDRRPIIGAVPDKNWFENNYLDLKYGKVKQYPKAKYLPGLYISTGYGSRGLSACPIAGELLANMINNEETILQKDIIDALNPARFIIRNLKRAEVI